jgi:hypothetical protein
MGYFVMEEDLCFGCSMSGYPELPDRISFLSGVWIELPDKKTLEFEIDCTAGEQPNHFFNKHIPVFSSALVEQFRLAGADNFQAFPAVLVNRKEGLEWDNYFALNVLGIIDAANETESISHSIMGGDKDDGVPALVHYEKLVIDQSRVKGALMFRELQSPDVLIFDEKIKEFLKANRPEDGWQIRLRKIESVSGV